MSDDAAVSDEQLREIQSALIAGACEVATHIRWLRRRWWMLQGIVLMNVTCGAWNASIVATQDSWLRWLNLGGLLLNAAGGWKAFKVAEDFKGDIAKGRAILVEIAQRIENIERVRNESRA